MPRDLLEQSGPTDLLQGAAPTEQPREIGPVEAGFLGTAQGLTGRFSDEFEGGVRALFAKATGDKRSFSAIFDEEVAPIRELIAEAKKQQPGAFGVGDIGGAVAGVGKLLSGGLAAKTAASSLPGVAKTPLTGAAAGIEGAAVSGAFAAGEAEGGLEKRVDAAAEAAPLGAAFGAAGQAAARGAQTAVEAFKGFKNVPQLQALRDVAGQAFEAAENAGVVIKNAAFRQFAFQAGTVLRRRGVDQTITPNAFRAMERAADLVSKNPSFRELMTLREIFRGATEAAKAGSKDRKLSEDLVRGLDEFIERQTPRTVTGGNPREAAAAYREARDLWRRLRKAEVIEDMFERARISRSQFSASGFENALRSEFRALAKNKKRLRGFTKPERAAIKRVASGGPVANIARFIGRFAPTGPVSGLGVGGLTVANPALGLAAGAAGLAGRGVATAARVRDVKALEALVRSGSVQVPGAARIGADAARGSIVGGGPALVTQ